MPRHAPEDDQGLLSRLHPANAEAISLRVLRRQFTGMPEEKRRQTQAYVRSLLQRAAPSSYLRRIARSVYEV